MAKNNLSKILAGAAVIGTGIAIGLALFKKYDILNKELEENEYENDTDFLSDFDKPDANDDKEYLTINSVKAPASNDEVLAEEEARDEAVEEYLKEFIDEELADELADESAKELSENLKDSRDV